MQLTQLRKGLYQRLFPRFKVQDATIYPFTLDGRDGGFWVPEGYVFDGATGAQLITSNDLVHEAAAGHDFGFDKLGKVEAFFLDAPSKYFDLSRQELDKIFIHKLREIYGVDWKIKLYRFGIKGFGVLFWYSRKWGFRK